MLSNIFSSQNIVLIQALSLMSNGVSLIDILIAEQQLSPAERSRADGFTVLLGGRQNISETSIFHDFDSACIIR